MKSAKIGSSVGPEREAWHKLIRVANMAARSTYTRPAVCRVTLESAVRGAGGSKPDTNGYPNQA